MPVSAGAAAVHHLAAVRPPASVAIAIGVGTTAVAFARAANEDTGLKTVSVTVVFVLDDDGIWRLKALPHAPIPQLMKAVNTERKCLGLSPYQD